MPDSGLPMWARRADRGVRTFAGLLAATIGVGDLWSPSEMILATAGEDVVHGWAWVCLVGGLVVAVAVPVHRWRWELVASSVLMVGLATRATAVWLTVDEGFRTAAAAGTTLAAMFFLSRMVYLLVFGVKVSAAPWARMRGRGVVQGGGN